MGWGGGKGGGTEVMNVPCERWGQSKLSSFHAIVCPAEGTGPPHPQTKDWFLWLREERSLPLVSGPSAVLCLVCNCSLCLGFLEISVGR